MGLLFQKVYTCVDNVILLCLIKRKNFMPLTTRVCIARFGFLFRSLAKLPPYCGGGLLQVLVEFFGSCTTRLMWQCVLKHLPIFKPNYVFSFLSQNSQNAVPPRKRFSIIPFSDPLSDHEDSQTVPFSL